MPWDTSFPDFNVSKKKLFYVTPENMQIAFFLCKCVGTYISKSGSFKAEERISLF